MKRPHLIRGLAALLIGTLVLVSLWTYEVSDWPDWRLSRELFAARNAVGFVGAILARCLVFLLGSLALFLLPPFFLLYALARVLGRPARGLLLGWTAVTLLVLLWAGSEAGGGPALSRQGWLGVLLCEGLHGLMGAKGSQIVLVFLSLIGLFALMPGGWAEGLRQSLARLLRLLPVLALALLKVLAMLVVKLGRALAAGLSAMALLGYRLLAAGWHGLGRLRARPAAREPDGPDQPERPDEADTRLAEIRALREDGAAAKSLAAAAALGSDSAPAAAPPPVRPKEARAGAPGRVPARVTGSFPLPETSLLKEAEPGDQQADRRFLEERARILVDKLASFNIGGRVSAMSQGPVVTTYEIEPDSGVKVIQIVSRREDLALALRSKELRLVAPIPGKAAVGVEVPNPRARLIRLREVLDAKEFKGRKGALALALGVDVDGVATWADLTEMPHLLVAGATGTGKSVCINSLLVSLLLAHGPDTLRLFLIDPKMLELSVYNEIPHLMHPVITDNRVALSALNWLVSEMERRYFLLKPAGVRSIEEYNQKIRAGDYVDEEGRRVVETLPYLVGVVEEFADLMMTLGKDIQTPLIRLAQMARAVGIHLILATQRPSVDIIDGVIKANFPSRIAFKVFSRFDSKTILDGIGAESLIGRGDMLFKHGRQPFPLRLHGTYIETDEVERVVAHWRAFKNAEATISLERRAGSDQDFNEVDDLFDDCRRIVIRAGFGSTTMLQRRLRIGYTRASRLMDMLEEAGIVGPHTGSKAREVLVGPETLGDEEEEDR